MIRLLNPTEWAEYARQHPICAWFAVWVWRPFLTFYFRGYR